LKVKGGWLFNKKMEKKEQGATRIRLRIAAVVGGKKERKMGNEA